MHNGRNAERMRTIAQEVRFLLDTFDQMHFRPTLAGERAGDDEAREAGPRANIEPPPRTGRQAEELQRVGHMTRPDVGQRRSRHQIGVLLHLKQPLHEAIEPLPRFT